MIIVVLGPSRSGKDTLTKHLNGVNLKFSKPQKWALEHWGGLPDGALELDEYRNQELPYTSGVTYLDALVATYHFWKDFAPLANKKFVIDEAISLLAEGKNAIFSDVRMIEELELIKTLGSPIIGIQLKRKSIDGLSTDKLLDTLVENLCINKDIPFMVYHNDLSITDLINFADYVNRTYLGTNINE